MADELDDLLFQERWAVPGLGLVVDAAESADTLALLYLRVPLGHRGAAVGIVTRLLAWCDRHGVDLAVTPTGEYGTDRERLVRILTRAGFEPRDWRQTGHTMLRGARV